MRRKMIDFASKMEYKRIKSFIVAEKQTQATALADKVLENYQNDDLLNKYSLYDSGERKTFSTLDKEKQKAVKRKFFQHLVKQNPKELWGDIFKILGKKRGEALKRKKEFRNKKPWWPRAA